MPVIFVENSDNELVKVITSYNGHEEIDTNQPDCYEVSSIPSPEYRTGLEPILFFNKNTKEFQYHFIPRPLTIEEEVRVLREKQKNPLERLAESSIDALSLEQFRTIKLEAFKHACSQSIYNGFTSDDTSYGFNEHDQSNFSQQLLLIVSGSNGGREIKWKSLDKGVVSLSEDQFITVINDAKNHKMAQQVKYWTLEAELLAATTKEAIDSINW